MGRRFYGCGRFLLVIAEGMSCCRPLRQRELEKSKAEERRQRGMFVATWVAIFCFMVLYLTK
ncbi:hypothetical protein RHMOL_Rhmol01G0197000 [Rhododendron molle]|uniref:Uncharacterized protein n=1 Tax=Rhododendron molle TaxID=49168 RepID=A0ACC0Q301_RHOML|nr:hypothetical protein RHMOL_Rhmol01G0197000 [Rhododendron molle]